jgi:hypothetical protein
MYIVLQLVDMVIAALVSPSLHNGDSFASRTDFQVGRHGHMPEYLALLTLASNTLSSKLITSENLFLNTASFVALDSLGSLVFNSQEYCNILGWYNSLTVFHTRSQR